MKRIILLVFCMLSLTFPVFGAQLDDDPLVDTQSLESALTQETKDIMGNLTPDSADFGDGAGQILKNGWDTGKIELKNGLALAAQMLAVVLLCSLVGCMGNSKLPQVASMAGVLAIAAIGFAALRAMSATGRDALSELQAFADMILPSISMATASCGSFTAASVLYVGTTIFVDFLTHLITSVLLPMVYTYTALAAADAAIGNHSLTRLKDVVGWIISGSLKTIVFVFTAYITITGVIAGNADSTTVKAAKLTLSGVVPVVGSMISDASETVVLSASVLRNSVGVFGMLAILGICIVPFIQTGIRYLILKVTGAVSGIFGTPQPTDLIASLSTAMGYLLAMTGVCALMLLISFVCYIKVVAV